MTDKTAPKKLSVSVVLESSGDKARWLKARGKKNDGKTFHAMLNSFTTATSSTSSLSDEMGAFAEDMNDEAIGLGIPLDVLLKEVRDRYLESVEGGTKGVALIASTVRDIMHANTATSQPLERTGISASVLFNKTGANQVTIRAYLKENAELIATHHKGVGIDDVTAHNRIAAQHRRNNTK